MKLSSTKTPGKTGLAERQTWIDQARCIAIVLVVMGHVVGQMRSQSGLAILIFNYGYIFHIPVCVILAGWGARRAEANGKNHAKIWWQLLLPYLIFQVVALGVNWLLDGKNPSWAFTNQTFGLWRLFALAGWRLLGPWFRRLPWAVPVSVVLALLAGRSPEIGSWLSISRILFFLPLLVVGPWLLDHVSGWRKVDSSRWTTVGYLVTLAAFVVLLGKDFWRDPFLGKSSYEELEQGNFAGMLVRAGAYWPSLLAPPLPFFWSCRAGPGRPPWQAGGLPVPDSTRCIRICYTCGS